MLSLRIGIVYCFLNLINHKRYVGSAKSGQHRFYNYWNDFKKNKCHNRYLFGAFLKYGAENFKVIILEEVYHIENDTTEWFHARLLHAEQFWMDYYASWDPKYGYNICPFANSRLGTKQSKISREKISKGVSGKNNPMYRKRYYGEDNPFYGKHHSEKTKRKIRKARKTQKFSKATRKKLRDSSAKRWANPEERKKTSANSKRWVKEHPEEFAVIRKKGVKIQHSNWILRTLGCADLID